MKVVSKIITGVVIAAAVAALGICSYMSTKVKYNAEGYIGNTASWYAVIRRSFSDTIRLFFSVPMPTFTKA